MQIWQELQIEYEKLLFNVFLNILQIEKRKLGKKGVPTRAKSWLERQAYLFYSSILPFAIREVLNVIYSHLNYIESRDKITK